LLQPVSAATWSRNSRKYGLFLHKRRQHLASGSADYPFELKDSYAFVEFFQPAPLASTRSENILFFWFFCCVSPTSFVFYQVRDLRVPFMPGESYGIDDAIFENIITDREVTAPGNL
jgi:hypothetical protein